MVKAWLATGTSWLRQHWRPLLVATALLVGGTWWWGRPAPSPVLPPIQPDQRIMAEGVVFPVRYAQMVMPVDGTIGEILVHEGEQIQVGQPLLRLVRSDYQARVHAAQADVARAAAVVRQQETNLIDAQRELARQQQLAAIGATPQQQLDLAKTAAARSQAALAQAKADLLTQQGRLAEADGLLDKTELRSPMAGTVMFLDIKVGEHAATGTVLVRIADESTWEIRSDDLTELAIAKVRLAAPAILTFDGIPGLEIPGKVKFIRPYGEKKRGDITYTVTVAPARWDERLRWNMTAQIAIIPTD